MQCPTGRHALGEIKMLLFLIVRVLVISDSLRLFATLWTVARHAPLSMGFSRQEYWSRLPFPSPGDLPNSGIKPMSPELAGRFFTAELPRKPLAAITSLS